VPDYGSCKLKHVAHCYMTKCCVGRHILLVCDHKNTTRCIVFLAQQSPVGQDLHIHEVSRSHTTPQHSR